MARYPIQGRVRDAQGNAISGATVTAYLCGTDTPATCYESYTGSALTGGATTSASDGSWSIYFDDGDYELITHFDFVAEKTGYGPVKYTMIR